MHSTYTYKHPKSGRIIEFSSPHDDIQYVIWVDHHTQHFATIEEAIKYGSKFMVNSETYLMLATKVQE